MPRAPNIIDDEENNAVDDAQAWARRMYNSALSNRFLGTPWKVYCRTFDHELWMRLTRIRGVWS